MVQFYFNNHKLIIGIIPYFVNYGIHPEYKDVIGFQLNEKAIMKVEIMYKLYKKLKTDLKFLL